MNNEQKKQQQELERQELADRMTRIKHKLIVLSGKGGVGKSTVAANLATTLARQGKNCGLLDIDIHGPSISEIMGIRDAQYSTADGQHIIPIEFNNLKVVSIGPMLKGSDDAVIWRGPMKHNLIKQFLKDVEWGELDFLIIDSPPGTGDEPLSVCQLIDDPTGAIIVTTPQKLSISDVRRSINFCTKLDMPVKGIVENMSGFVCPHCGEEVNIFSEGGGERLASELNLPFLGKIPLNPAITRAGDAGYSEAEDLLDPVVSGYFEGVIATLEKEIQS